MYTYPTSLVEMFVFIQLLVLDITGFALCNSFFDWYNTHGANKTQVLKKTWSPSVVNNIFTKHVFMTYICILLPDNSVMKWKLFNRCLQVCALITANYAWYKASN